MAADHIRKNGNVFSLPLMTELFLGARESLLLYVTARCAKSQLLGLYLKLLFLLLLVCSGRVIVGLLLCLFSSLFSSLLLLGYIQHIREHFLDDLDYFIHLIETAAALCFIAKLL